MSEHVTIRPATADDAEAIQRVARASWHAAYDSILGADVVDETVDSWYDPERLVADDVRDDSRPFFVAEVDAVVGFAEAAPAEDDETYHLYRIYVHPNHWGRGIGRSLLDRLERTLRDRGAERLRLQVLADNDVGVEFYETTGFQRVEETTDEAFDVLRYAYEKSLA